MTDGFIISEILPSSNGYNYTLQSLQEGTQMVALVPLLSKVPEPDEGARPSRGLTVYEGPATQVRTLQATQNSL